MHEFCPLCLKNGNKIRIKSFQLNFQEAVFMCSNEKCTWPIGFEDLIFLNRPVGKEWSYTWDESALKYIKNEHDLSLDFSSYTPPQTPSSDVVCKEGSNCSPTDSTFVSDKVPNSLPMLTNTAHNSQEICSTLSEPSESSVESSTTGIVNLKPKVVAAKSVNYVLEKLSTVGYTVKENNEINNIGSKLKSKLNDCQNNTNVPTSLASDLVSVKNDEFSNSSSTLRLFNGRFKENVRFLSRKKRNIPYEKFDFNKLMNKKSTNVEKICELTVDNIDKVENSSTLRLNEKVKEGSYTKLHSNELLNSQHVNENNECYNGNTSDIKSSNSVQPSLSSILSPNNASKGSGINKDLTEKDELDLQLEELLSGFSEEENNTGRNDTNNAEDYDWISTLFD